MTEMKEPTFEHLDNSMTREEQLGEEIFEEERKYTLWQAIKIHKRILLHCIAAFGAGTVFGYDTIVSLCFLSNSVSAMSREILTSPCPGFDFLML
jgi:hypothetical protein